MSEGLDSFLFSAGWFMMGLVTAAVVAYALGWFEASWVIEAWS